LPSPPPFCGKKVNCLRHLPDTDTHWTYPAAAATTSRIVEHTTHIILIGEVVETVLGDGHSLVYVEGGFSSVPRPLSAA